MEVERADIDLNQLANLIQKEHRPVHLNRLAHFAVSSWLETNAKKRQYAPGATYKINDTIEFSGGSATITDIQLGYNPNQGEFQILTLTFADGDCKYVAAGIPGAPDEDRIEVTPEQIKKQLDEHGLMWRTAVQDALAQDEQFIHFQDELGDQWCLAEILPAVEQDELQQAWTTIQSEVKGPFRAVPTERLISAIWRLENDGSEDYLLFVFALNSALEEFREVLYVAGAGWMLSDHWLEIEERPSLVGPRMPNIVSEATDEEVEEDEAPELVPDQDEEVEQLMPDDIESWRHQRLNEATLTLRANHYYHHWLPLNRSIQRLFPPRPCRVRIYHRLGDQEASFTAVVNPNQKRILAEQTMYDAFYENGIYPGAKLTISHRGNEHEYDIRTRPIEDGQSLIVRRIFRNERGQLEYSDDEEPLRYEVEGDVFVAAARWEDLPALFQQAEEAGQGIFGRMFEKCQQWQEERGTPLIVTAEELFEAIHFGPRMTSKATIAYELWRRLAFKPLGNGRYQFHPEKGEKTRSHGLTRRRPSKQDLSSTQRKGKAKSLTRLQKQKKMPPIQFSAADLWVALKGREEKGVALETAVVAYKAHPFREKMIFLRETAHRCIRKLLSPQNLDELTLDDFNEQVWQLGTIAYKGHRARIGSAEIENLLQDMSLQEVHEAYQAGHLILAGNQTWGSSTSVYGTQFKDKTDAAKTKMLRVTLRDLLYGVDSDVIRIARAIQESNGFGINIASGLLHALYPERHILYNRRSVAMLTSLGIAWPRNWRRNAGAYLVYRDTMQKMRTEFDFVNLTDVDWFVYGWGGWQTVEEIPTAPELIVSKVTATRPKFEVTKSGQLIATDLVSLGPLFEERPAIEEPESPTTGYFIFQQKPESEYDDQTGVVYNWRQGIPNYKQVQPGSRFIYYRPGEKVFFGCGRIEWIETSQDEEGRTIYDGQIEDYDAWKPPLPLTKSLAVQLSFVDQKRLGIGQAGIRRITATDFETIRKAYRYFLSQKAIDEAEDVATPEATGKEETSAHTDEFGRMRALIEAHLNGETIHTLTGKPNVIKNITKTGILVQSSQGTAEVRWEWIEQIYDRLREQGEIEGKKLRKEKPRLRGSYRSAFIFALLVQFEHISSKLKPIRLFHRPPKEVELRTVKSSSSEATSPATNKSAIWTEDKIIAKFQGIRIWRRGKKIAPHKPLLLIHALARCKRGDPRLIPYSQIDQDLTRLLIRFYPEGRQQLTEYPFWRLQNDGLWEVPDAGQFSTLKGNTNPSKNELLEANVVGGFPQPLYVTLQANPELIEQAIQILLDSYLPPDKHQDIREDVGLITTIEEIEEPHTEVSTQSPPSVRREPRSSRRTERTEDMTKTSKSLFSQHYLDFRLADQPEWQIDVSAPLSQVQALYEAKKNLLSNYNEAQTEDEFIRPLLELLGFAYTVQTGYKKSGHSLRPDHTLFADEMTKTEADRYLNDETPFYDRALAICEAKYWDRPLTQQRAESDRGDFDNRNPSFQIVNYLTGTGVDWGILTNGRLWRLYYRQASSTANEFYEVDLVDLLGEGDPEAFKRFWLFFRKDAFVRDKTGQNFLERVREGSTTYARAVSEALKGRVFEEVFPLLAGGFVEDMSRRGDETTGDDARALIKEATLSLLYKLLFLLYAEARDLLPVDNPGYRKESITQMVQGVADRLDRKVTLGQTSTTYYRRLINLFEMIDRGDSAFGLPRYNGGLFHFDFAAEADRTKHQANYFLRQHTINDARLAKALDLLARVDGQIVDYSFLEVRHLGAVYEGLLEYKLLINDPQTGTVSLETDKGERKATGTYYTPDYIVKYIVHHTLDPILQEREARFGELMAEIGPKRERLIELNRRLNEPQTPPVESRYRNEAHLLRQDLNRLEKEAREILLDIKVCDPAMGSGHFLVEAVDYLTDRLITILNQHPDHNPILSQLADIRDSILDNLAEQDIVIDAARLHDTQLLQRTVMKRCIYGVDLNHMAVELAKLSLWLHSFTIGAPLSFLDHHLRRGNSLLGAMARDAAATMQVTKTSKKKSRGARLLAEGRGEEIRDEAVGFQYDLFGGPFRGLLRAAKLMRGISSLSDATLAEVEQSEALFNEFDEAAKPYKKLLDVHVAQHFGVKDANDFLRLYGVEIMDAPEERLAKQYQQVLRQTRELFGSKRFFHWDLEFPEVFIDLDRADWKANPGFDGIVGNPPYIPNEQMEKREREFYSQQYPVSLGKYDLSVVFLNRVSRLIANPGLLGMIVPTTWQTGENYLPFRSNFADELLEISVVINLPYDVFPDAYVDTCVAVFRNPSTNGFKVFAYPKRHNLTEILLKEEDFGWVDLDELKTDSKHRIFANSTHYGFLAKFRKHLCIPLGTITEACQGPVESFYTYSENPESVGDLPYFSCSVYRYEIHILERTHIHFGSDNPLRKFYTQPRILIRRIVSRSNRLMAVAVEETFVVKKDLNPFIVVDQKFSLYYLLALVNSSLFSYLYLEASTAAGKDDFRQTTLSSLRDLPVRDIVFVTEKALREELRRTMLQDFSTRPLDTEWFLGTIEDLLSANKIDVVHDLLAALSRYIQEINKQKQNEANAFLAWLEDYTSLAIDIWALKTIVQSYFESGWEEFGRSLNRNARAIQDASGVDVKSRDALSRIKGEYNRSMSILTPLMARIQATDDLIDQIVYKLYGLTEEEIAIVEGSD